MLTDPPSSTTTAPPTASPPITTTAPEPTTSTTAPTTTTPPTTLSPAQTTEQQLAVRTVEYLQGYYDCVADPEECDPRAFLDEYTTPAATDEREITLEAWEKEVSDGTVAVPAIEPTFTVGWARVNDDTKQATTFACQTSRYYSAPRSVLTAPSTTPPPEGSIDYGVSLFTWERQPDDTWLIVSSEADFATEPAILIRDALTSATSEEIDACFAQ